VARNGLTGEPSDPEVKAALERKKEERRAKNPDWQDPKLLADIKAQTGLDLTIGKKSRGKGKRKLAPAAEEEDSPRKRLEKKLRAGSRRVAAALSEQDGKRRGDKFADQFNYIFER